MNGTSDETGDVAYPFGGGGKKKKVGGNPFNQSPIIRRPSPVGEPTSKKEKGVDMSDTTDRKGGKNHSISINYVNEGLEEANFLQKAALSAGILGASLFGGSRANAQNAQPQQNDTIQVDNSRISKEHQQDFSNRTRGSMKSTGMSDKDIDTEGNIYTNFNIANRNGKGEANAPIKNYLLSIKPSKSTENIHVSSGTGNNELRTFLGKLDKETAMKYKAFILPNEVFVIMPINYTLQDVQDEFGIFQLGDFDI